MATIKPIEGRTIHQIQSGQVIVDLCSVVKELVENSLDAGATSIEVRFKNQGLDAIEVHDNGGGIAQENYETVALKHHTSKLSSYSDLSTLNTFGFRGEALSSLCALSRFTIVTCMAADAPKGTKLDFEISGKLKGTTIVAAQKGTTVSVENLFNNLPVRRRELERNIKREWNRVITMLGQYACIQTSVKVTVTQQTPKGKKTTLFSTKGNPTTRENIVNVFGAKTLVALITLDLKLELEPTSETSQRWTTHEDGTTKEIRIVGYISRPAFGEGRQTPDKQMFFVNSRPCGLPQVAKAFNEVYKSYNSHQSPFIFADIQLDTHLYDVNVSPDKRTILLHDQTRMLEQLKSSLTSLFEAQDHLVPISQLPAKKQPIYKQLTISRSSPTATVDAGTEEDGVESTSTDEVETDDQTVPEDDNEPQEPPNRGSRISALSRDSTSRDGKAVSLISKWHDNMTEGRKVDRSARQREEGKSMNELPNERLNLLDKLALQQDRDEDAVDGTRRQPDNTSNTDVPFQLPIPVLDFNERIAELTARGTTDKESRTFDIPTISKDAIPTLHSPSKPASSALLQISSQVARPHRIAETTATITIGDHVVTSSIGTPSFKRARIEREPPSVHDKPSLPSFGTRLSQRFAASNAVNVDDSSPQTDNEDSSSGKDSLIGTDMEDASEDENSSIQDMQMENPSIIPSSADTDGDSIDEEVKKAREDAKVQKMIETVALQAALPPEDIARRAVSAFKGGSKRRDATGQLVLNMTTSVTNIASDLHFSTQALAGYEIIKDASSPADEAELQDAEEKLSLTINQSDFAKMRVIGQFNLGFILATQISKPGDSNLVGNALADDVFIIDQHASDEKYNFERLQSTTVVQSQPLVRPKTLELTAVEEEIVMENLAALQTNGFIVTVDESGESQVGQRCKLISLPVSKETTFALSDLEELISLLSEHPSGTVPRPSKVRKMFAMRACRSSIMIGRTLTHNHMGTVLRHMGEIDKPWNCPHGRPTMRHLCGLAAWDEAGWKEGNGLNDENDGVTDWAAYLRQAREKD